MRKLILIAFLLTTTLGFSQAWSGILSTSRAIDWTSAGVTGGIPSATWSQCGSTIVAGATATTIQAALNSCAANHYVQLGAGTFTLSAGLNMPPNVVLRGNGPDSTFLVFSSGGGVGCGGEGSQICFMDSNGYYYGSAAVAIGGTNSATVCGTASSGACNNTYTQGSTTIQLSSVGAAGIVNGQYIYLDQNNDTSTTASTTFATGMPVGSTQSNTDGLSLEAGSPGRCSTGVGGSGCVSGGGVDRNQIQLVKVVSGCSAACTGAGPFNVTITPGIYSKKWASSYSPGAWWSANNMQNAGIENLSIDSTAIGTARESGIYFNNAFNCWVSNVRSIKPNRNHVWLWQSAHNTIQNSYFFGTQGGESQSYGVESYISSDNLILNNVFQQVTAPIILGPSLGSVIAYNFGIDDSYYVVAWMQQALASRHDAGALYNLFEGNISSGYWEDMFHGTGGANTAFRNYLVGWESGKTEETVPVQMYSYSREENLIGNVLGCNNATSSYPGNCGTPYHTTYQTSTGVAVAHSIYDLGAGNAETAASCGFTGGCVVLADSYVATSLLRWGNYDVVNATAQWNSAEVPSGLTDGYANAVPSSHTLPASLWASSAPAWWAGLWPSIGPDVTTGTVPGVAGHVALTPAANCYLSTMGGPADGSGNVLTFNANACYSSSGSLTLSTSVIGSGTITGCAGSYTSGASYYCTVTPGTGYVLSGSPTGCSGSGTTTYSGTITANCTVGATFTSSSSTAASGCVACNLAAGSYK
jgi:hypothetical protein